MRIANVLWQHRNDYQADMVCEFCDAHQLDTAGYADEFYVNRVIPHMRCQACGRSSDGSGAARAGNVGEKS